MEKLQREYRTKPFAFAEFKFWKYIQKHKLYFSVLLSFSVLIPLFKYDLGFDERAYFDAAFSGDSPWQFPKLSQLVIYMLICIKTALGLFLIPYTSNVKLVISKLILAVLVLTTGILCHILFYRLVKFSNDRRTDLIDLHIFTMAMTPPVFFGKNLYSIFSLPIIPIYYLIAIALTFKKNIYNSLVVALLFFLSTIIRLDSLISFVIFDIFLIAQLYHGNKNKKSSTFLVSMNCTFVLLFSFFYYTTYVLHGLLVPPILMSGWNSDVWVDGPSKVIMDCLVKNVQDMCGFGNMSMGILLSFVDNVKEFSRFILAVDVYPIYLAGLSIYLFATMKKKLNNNLIYLLAFSYAISSLGFLFFEIEARYLMPLGFSISLVSIFILANQKSINLLPKKAIYISCALSSIQLLLYLLTANSTYS